MVRPMLSGQRRGALAKTFFCAGIAVAMLAGAASASAADVVVARQANLTERIVDAGTGADRIASATVRQDRRQERAQATVTLGAAPQGPTGSMLIVAFGPIRDGVCDLNDFLDADQYVTPIGGQPAEGWSRNGRTYRLDIADDAAGYQPWECAGAIIASGGENVSFLGGTLREIFLKPQLRLLPPRILERPVRGRLPLVRGATHVIRIPIRSVNGAEARGVVVTGAGRGLRVGRSPQGMLLGESTHIARLSVRAVGRRVGPLVVRVTSRNGPAVRRRVPVRLTRPPARPRPGLYRSADGDVRFRITAGRRPMIRDFRIDTLTRCGGYMEFPIYTPNTYTFPNRAIGGGGVLDASQRTKLYSVSLRFRAVGGRVVEGRFSYSVRQAPCSASDSFTARRVGR